AAVNPGRDEALRAQTLYASQTLGWVAGAIVNGQNPSAGASIGGQAGLNAAENNWLRHQQWREFSTTISRCAARNCTPEEQQAIREAYAQTSANLNIALANCDKTGDCAELASQVVRGTNEMLDLAGEGKLPVGGAVGNDLGQSVGQRLANDPAYRHTVQNSLAVLDHCNANPGACTQQAIRAAAIVVAPLLIPAGVALTATGVTVGGGIGAIANLGGQLYANQGHISQVNPVDVGMASMTGALTYGASFWPSLFVNTGGAIVSSGINTVASNQNPSTSQGSIFGAAAGTALGYPIGAAVQGGLNSIFNPWWRATWHNMGYGIQTWANPNSVPALAGSAFGSIGQETGNAVVNKP
ncbi:VENN motif pre-toxin domain-containing protein, partial [Xenophilus arseniciresistens]